MIFGKYTQEQTSELLREANILQITEIGGMLVRAIENDGHDFLLIEGLTGENIIIFPRSFFPQAHLSSCDTHEWARTCLAAGVWPESARQDPRLSRGAD